MGISCVPMSLILAKERTRDISKIFSHWPRTCSTLDRIWPLHIVSQWSRRQETRPLSREWKWQITESQQWSIHQKMAAPSLRCNGNFSRSIWIKCQLYLRLIRIVKVWSLQTFAHDTTAVLSWHVQILWWSSAHKVKSSKMLCSSTWNVIEKLWISWDIALHLKSASCYWKTCWQQHNLSCKLSQQQSFQGLTDTKIVLSLYFHWKINIERMP